MCRGFQILEWAQNCFKICLAFFGYFVAYDYKLFFWNFFEALNFYIKSSWWAVPGAEAELGVAEFTGPLQDPKCGAHNRGY